MYLVQANQSSAFVLMCESLFCFCGVLLIPGTGLTRQDESEDIRDDVAFVVIFLRDTLCLSLLNSGLFCFEEKKTLQNL
jgi:hypothetical protein